MAEEAASALNRHALLDRMSETRRRIVGESSQVAGQIRVVVSQIEQLVVVDPAADTAQVGIRQTASLTQQPVTLAEQPIEITTAFS